MTQDGYACNFFDVMLAGRSLLYLSYVRLKIKEHHPFRLGFVFTAACTMIVYENVLKLSIHFSIKCKVLVEVAHSNSDL